MATSCDIPTEFIEAFDAPDFQNTKAIRWMHGITPRFGHSRNLLLLMQGNEDEQKDYIRGLIASSIAVFSFFLVWMIFLLIFKCMGPNEAGILSGRPKELQAKPHNPQDLAAWDREYAKVRKRLNLLRGLVLFAGFSIILSSILMSANG
jgi:hypothetical protein